MIPSIGDWVVCCGTDVLDMDTEAGKVTSIDYKEEKFTGDFFTEWSSDEDVGGTADLTFPLSQIKEIITDQEKIRQFERELAGEIKFEEGL